MTPSQLKYEIEIRGEYPHFFTRKTMKFFGDTMGNFGVRSSVKDGFECWELYRKRPVQAGLKDSHYFRKGDFKKIH